MKFKILAVALMATGFMVNAAPVAPAPAPIAPAREKKDTLTNLSDLITNATKTKDAFDQVKKDIGASRAVFTPKSQEERDKASKMSKYAKGKVAIDVAIKGLQPIKMSLAFFTAFASLMSDASAEKKPDVAKFIDEKVYPKLIDAQDTVKKVEQVATLLMALIPEEPKVVAKEEATEAEKAEAEEVDPFA